MVVVVRLIKGVAVLSAVASSRGSDGSCNEDGVVKGCKV